MRAQNSWRDGILRGQPVARVVKTFLPDKVETAETSGIRKASFTISNGVEDRDGDTIDPAGWVLDHYRKNPVVLWAHDQAQPPIARSEKVWVEGGQLKSVAVWPERGVYPFADQIYDLLKGGFIKGTSVGFHPIEAVPRGREKGISFRKQELYEYSILPIPSNRDALVEAKAAGHEIGALVEYCREFVESADTGLWVQRGVVEKALAALGSRSVTVSAPPSGSGATTRQGGHAGAGTASKIHHPHIVEEDGRYKVVDDDGHVYGSHDTRESALEQLKALYANKGWEDSMTVQKEGPPWAQGGGDGKKPDGQPPPPEQKPPAALPPEIQAAHDAMLQQLPQIIANQDPTAKANALKQALETFAAACMGGQQQQAPPPGGNPPPPPPPPQKDADFDELVTKTAELLADTEDPLAQLMRDAGVTKEEFEASIKKATQEAIAEARTALTGRLRD